MLEKPNIGAIVFYVKDLRRSEAFYRDVLGLPTTLREGDEGSYMMATAGETALIFFQEAVVPGKSPVVVFVLEGGIENLVEQLAAKGVEIVTPVTHAPDGGLTSNFMDPDRHTLSFYQPAGAPART